MPWLTLRYQDPFITKLSLLYDVEAVPTLVMIDPLGHVINKRARVCIENDPLGRRFPYYPEAAQSLCDGVESYGYDMNTKPTLVVLMENSSAAEQEGIISILTQYGTALVKDMLSEPSGPEMLFFYACKPSENSHRVRVLCRLPRSSEEGPCPRMVILDVPDAGTYYEATGGGYGADAHITEESVLEFIEGFRCGSLTKRKLR